MNYESVESVASPTQPNVQFVIRKMSYGRRIELMRRVRDLGPRLEYLRAGTTQSEEVESGLLSAEIDKLYLEWGLQDVSGLEIDGKQADVEMLIQSGPEHLLLEALAIVKRSCGLTEHEAKN